MTKFLNSLPKIAATISFLLALFLGGLQLIYLYVQQAFYLHYIWEETFYLVNMGIILFAFLGVLPFTKKKWLAAALSGTLILLQMILMFFGTSTTVLTSTSPNGENIFIVRKSKATNELTYERSIYYEFPQLQAKLSIPTTKNGSWLLSKSVEYLTYPAKKSEVIWLTDNVAVLNYETPDGSREQFIRAYQDAVTEATPDTLLAPLVGTWSDETSKNQLQGGGNTYPVTIAGKSYTLDPTYAKVYGENMAVFHDQTGNAICTLVLNQDGTLSLLMTDGRSYHLKQN